MTRMWRSREVPSAQTAGPLRTPGKRLEEKSAGNFVGGVILRAAAAGPRYPGAHKYAGADKRAERRR